MVTIECNIVNVKESYRHCTKFEMFNELYKRILETHKRYNLKKKIKIA